MTGEWEHKLRQIEEGSMSRSQFMKDIAHLTEEFVSKTTGFEETASNLKETSLFSPINKEPLFEGLGFYQNIEGNFKIPKSIAGRRLPVEEVNVLLEEGRIGPLDNFISKAGKAFSAILQLDDEYKVKFVFQNNDEQEAKEKESIAEAPIIAKCPICETDEDRLKLHTFAQVIKKFRMLDLVTFELLESYWTKKFRSMNS